MIRLGVTGAAGRMGSAILRLAAEAEDLEIVARIESPERAGSLAGLVPLKEADLSRAAVVIDFSAPGSTMELLSATSRPALVIGTTGFAPDQIKAIQAAAKSRAIVFAPNMSVGANLLFAIAEEAARVLGPEFDPEIIEAHHRHKKDAPSGTAKGLFEAVCRGRGLDPKKAAVHGREGMGGERPRDVVGIHAVRAGEIVGIHTVMFGGSGETVELRHDALSRDAFAAGALRAARFAAGQKNGLFDMKAVLGIRS